THVQYDEAAKWLSMTRGAITVICNLGTASMAHKITEVSSILLSSPAIEITGEEVRIPNNGVVILRHQ
ncbi:MAG TPA: hypothetical protein VL346_13745, partial [Acidobacteriaceae bacterium]|nr:hypothetical protein [Acidobacteriaceae bacterium]